jgi:hypothetical protein
LAIKGGRVHALADWHWMAVIGPVRTRFASVCLGSLLDGSMLILLPMKQRWPL